jgi:serine/threonine-protein kinase
VVIRCPRCQRSFPGAEGVRYCPVDGALVLASVEDQNLGKLLLGQFEVREVCGKGAMGTVYRAWQRNMDRLVAVKILRRELLKEAEVVRRFLREARAAARLQHPNIVTVHLVGETDDGSPFLVMEYIDGVSLENILEAQGAQPPQRVVALGRQIASALDEAHSAQVVHRDLKPANILVTDRARVPDLVKVLDFGIAKMLTGADQSILTKEGVIFGTPHYIAPEQASGTEVDARADLYSLGVILFRMATGRLPFEGTQGMQVVLKHLREAPPRPGSLANVPEALDALILRLLSKDPARRPPDAQSVIQALEQITVEASAQGTLLGVSPEIPLQPAAKTVPAKRPGMETTGKVRPLPPPDASVKSGPEAVTLRPPSKNESVRRDSPVPSRPLPTPMRGSGRGARSGSGSIHPPVAWWGKPWVWLGAVAAIAIGAGIGVGVALLQRGPEPQPQPAPPVVILPTPAPPAAKPEPPPEVTPPPATVATPAPVEKKESRRKRSRDDEDLPVTVVPADPPAPPSPPRRIAGTTSSSPSPARTVTSPPPAPATASPPPTRTVVDHPKPVSPPPRDPTIAPDDRPPPPSADPTTIPLPSPDETR